MKISIAGAKLSHLVQKDKIWDHGSMAEQARIIFYLVNKAKASGNVDSLKKQCTVSCFEKIKADMRESEKYDERTVMKPVIREVAIVEVNPGKNNKPDMFSALIKGVSKIEIKDAEKGFSAQCLFVRQGEWWMLDDIRE